MGDGWREELVRKRARTLARIDAEPEGRFARLQRVLHVKNTSNQSLRRIMKELAPDASIAWVRIGGEGTVR